MNLSGLIVIAGVVLTGFTGLLIGRYYVPVYSSEFCKLEESKAIEGVEDAASGLYNDLQECRYVREKEVSLWKTRANQCMGLLMECANYLEGNLEENKGKKQ